jgi:hypothetical protein
MPAAEVTAYLRDTHTRVASLRAVRRETLAATNPVAAWLMECCDFHPEAATSVGTKVVLTVGTDEPDNARSSADGVAPVERVRINRRVFEGYERN